MTSTNGNNHTPQLIDNQERYRWRTGSLVTTVTDAATWHLSVCQGRRMSHNTLKAYRNGFNQIGKLLADITGHAVNSMPLEVVNRNDLGDAFNEYAATRSPASQKQAWAVWNGMCQLLVDHEIIERNPMTHVPSGERTAVTLARALPTEAVEALLATLAAEDNPDRPPHPRRWRERDHAMVLTDLTTAARASELCGINFGDITAPYSDGQARQLLIRGKGRKERSLTIEAPVVQVLEKYLRTRIHREGDNKGTPREDDIWSLWGPEQALFIQVGGKRATPGMFYRRLENAYKEAGITAHRADGALPHQLRHTVATMLADDPAITPHDLKTFLGHSSLSSAERYTLGAGRATRAAGRHNPVYRMVEDQEQED